MAALLGNIHPVAIGGLLLAPLLILVFIVGQTNLSVCASPISMTLSQSNRVPSLFHKKRKKPPH